jgi:lipopolysaccharide transport system permease protein
LPLVCAGGMVPPNRIERTAQMIRFPGFSDIIQGLGYWSLWLRMGWMDIVRRYRRTTLGPFWNTLSVGIFIGVCGFMYAGVFGQPLDNYMPYISSGFTVWIPMATYIAESAGAFLSGEGTLKQMKMPYSIYIYSGLVRNIIVFFHNFTIFLIVIIIFPVPINTNTLLIFPAMALLAVNAIWIGILVALLCTRYRDLQQAIASALQVMFFITPIFWEPGQAGRAQRFLVDINPLYHFVDILRSPMLGKTPSISSWQFVILTTLVGWTLTVIVFNRYRNRIIFWY